MKYKQLLVEYDAVVRGDDGRSYNFNDELPIEIDDYQGKNFHGYREDSQFDNGMALYIEYENDGSYYVFDYNIGEVEITKQGQYDHGDRHTPAGAEVDFGYVDFGGSKVYGESSENANVNKRFEYAMKVLKTKLSDVKNYNPNDYDSFSRNVSDLLKQVIMKIDQ